MIPTNPERNSCIYSLWESGHTIDQIAAQLNIPRSTVGYYVRKFNQYGRDGKHIVIPQSPLNTTERKKEVYESAMMKVLTTTKLLEMFKSRSYEEIYYFLSIFKPYKELLSPSREESKVVREETFEFLKTLAQMLNQTPNNQVSSQASEASKPSRSLSEIFPG